MINPRFSADWSTHKRIEPISCTPSVQEVYTKAEIVHLTPGLLGLRVLFKCHIINVLRNILLTLDSLQFGVQPSRLKHSLVHQVNKEYISKLRSYTLSLVS